MKQLHICPRNLEVRDIAKPAIEIYTYDKDKEHRSWYINAHIVFYCPYCGVDLKIVDPTEHA